MDFIVEAYILLVLGYNADGSAIIRPLHCLIKFPAGYDKDWDALNGETVYNVIKVYDDNLEDVLALFPVTDDSVDNSYIILRSRVIGMRFVDPIPSFEPAP